MEPNNTGTICPFCNTALQEGDKVTVCPACGAPHHEHCWSQGGGCANPSCPQHRQAAPAQGSVCAGCGAPLAEGQAFCAKCGMPRGGAPGARVCAACGAPLAEGQEFCSKCGQRAGAPIQDRIPVGAPPAPPAKKNSTKIILIAAAAVVVVAAVLIFFLKPGGGPDAADSGPNFQALYDEYCDATWADLGDDGSYLYIDTNPEDNEDDGLAYVEAYSAVKNVNKALALPDSVLSDMEETTGADGKQSEEFDDLNLTVSWRYHPDRGLEVTYKKNH